MKHFLFIFAFSIGSTAALAQDCMDHLKNPNWPKDKLEFALSCTLAQTAVGNPQYSYNQLCFGITRTDFSGFKDHLYMTYRFNKNAAGGWATIVSQDESGTVKEGSVSKKGSVLQIREYQSSFEFGQKWIEETTLDLASGAQVNFKTYEDGWFSNPLKQSEIYTCTRIK